MMESHRIRALATLSLCLFLVPFLAWLATPLLMSDADAQWRALREQPSLAQGVDRRSTQAELVASCGSNTPPNGAGPAFVSAYRHACTATREVTWVRYLAAGSAALGALLIGSIYGARTFAGAHRRRMALVFGPVVRWVLVLLAMSTLAQAGLFIYGLLVLEVALLQGIHIGVVMAGIVGAGLTGYALLQASLGALRDDPLTIVAIRLERTEHPALFALVDGVAEKLHADPPQHVVLGLDPVFFVTAAHLRLAGDGGPTVLKGSTLYLSLSLMRIFNVDELAAVIGHEFAHLRGDDLIYSQKFAPMYARLRRATDRLNQPAGLAMEFGRLPAIAALSACELEFAAAERAVGRQRELLADQAGAEVVGARTLCGALVKAALLTGTWNVEGSHLPDQPGQKQEAPHLAQAYAQRCEAYIDTLDWPAALTALEGSVQPHPVDTHPRLLDRIQGLGVRLSDLDRPTVGPPDRAATRLLDRAITLDEELSALRERVQKACGGVASTFPGGLLRRPGSRLMGWRASTAPRRFVSRRSRPTAPARSRAARPR